jgi:hypothetical protein
VAVVAVAVTVARDKGHEHGHHKRDKPDELHLQWRDVVIRSVENKIQRAPLETALTFGRISNFALDTTNVSLVLYILTGSRPHL